MEPAETLTLLWANLTQRACDQKALASFERLFAVRRLNGADFNPEDVSEDQIQALVLEYDYPDRASLNVLRLTKNSYPSIPVIMLTEQHSEALAVWAFRARVWDYMVKPILDRQVDNLYAELVELRAMKSRRDKSIVAHRDNNIPVELRVGNLLGDARLLQPAECHIADHYADKISLDEVASKCGMSPYRFSRLFKKNYGQTFQDYLLRRRVEEAAKLLGNRSALVVDVAYLTGFNDPSYFARVFKRYMGVTPAEFRESRDLQAPGPVTAPATVPPLSWGRH